MRLVAPKTLGGLLLSRAGVGDARTARLRGMIQGATSSLANKALSVIISFISVPLTLHYLGKEQFGAWVVIGSTISWLTIADFGLGHGLNNAITTAVAQGKTTDIRMHLSNYLASIVTIALMVAIAIAVCSLFVDFSSFFGIIGRNASREVNVAVVLAVGSLLVRMPLASTTKVYNAYQEGRLGNAWGAAGNVVSFLCLLAVVHTHGGLPLLVIATSGVPLVIDLANNIWLYQFHRPDISPSRCSLDLKEFHQIRQVGVQFFVLMLMALVTFQTDNIVIGHIVGAAAIPQYSITYSLFNYATLPQSLLFPYLWTAYNEAIARGDIAWVRRMFLANLSIGVLGTSCAATIMILACKPFISWWAGPNVVPSTALAVMTALWVVINAYTNPIACLFAAASHLKNQIVYSAVATALNLILSIILVSRYGVVGAISGTVVAYTFFVCIPIIIDAQMLFRKLESLTDLAEAA